MLNRQNVTTTGRIVGMLSGGLGGTIIGKFVGCALSVYAVNLLEYLQSDGREDDVYAAYLLLLMPILGIGGLVYGAKFGIKVGFTTGEVVADTVVTGAIAVADSTNRFLETRTLKKVKHFCDTFAESSQDKDINDENISKIITDYLVPA